MKRMIACCLAFIMVVTLMPAVTFAGTQPETPKTLQKADKSLKSMEKKGKKVRPKSATTKEYDDEYLYGPMTVAAEPYDYNSILLMWDDDEYPEGFLVWRTTTPYNPDSWEIVGEVWGDDYDFLLGYDFCRIDTGLKTGTTYYYIIDSWDYSLDAYDDDGFVFSNSDLMVSARPTLGKTTKVKAKSKKRKQVTVTWKKVAGASGYQVQKSYKKNKGYKSAGTVKKKTSKTIKNLKRKKNCYVKVRAYRTVSGKKVYGRLSGAAKAKVK
ncbi:hypothetical protein NE619_16140 [Anaerovorax odorimutans]|uniref:Fibronectin type-III domain-containing protein n=2 Tax=Anaerovorax odorimutans TaxID=109327 RepID=A0ABT1RSV1_9FIRM|nr:hypothetical protein [Anaerovorax odorimutans]